MKNEEGENGTVTGPVASGEFIPRIIVERGKKYLLVGALTVGRNPNNDIRLPPDDKIASRLHAKIFFDEGKNAYFLEDYSSNGTIVNGKKIWHKKVKIKNADIIEMGTKTRLWFFTKEPGILEWLKGKTLKGSG